MRDQHAGEENFCRTWRGGGLKGSKGGFEGGCCSIKIRNFHLPYFGIMFEKGTDFF